MRPMRKKKMNRYFYLAAMVICFLVALGLFITSLAESSPVWNIMICGVCTGITGELLWRALWDE